MTENEFWGFLGQARSKGTVPVVAGSFSTGNDEVDKVGEYITGHGILTADYDNLPQHIIVGMGKLLFNKDAARKTKTAVMMFLAHQSTYDALFFLEEYNKAPDEDLEVFAQLALDECIMWNDKNPSRQIRR